MTGALLLKGLADLTFGGAFLWYLVKFLVSLGVAYGAILLVLSGESQKMKRQTILRKRNKSRLGSR